MTMPMVNQKLSFQMLKHLRDYAKSSTLEEQAPVDAMDYDWNVPHHFNPENMTSLENFGKKLEEQIKRTFENTCQDEFIVSITSISQYYAYSLINTHINEKQNNYFLPFITEEEKRSGYIEITPATAATLVSFMLHDMETINDEEKKLSQLEDSILMDIVAAVANTISTTLTENGAEALNRTAHFIKGDWPLDYSEIEDITTISFTIDNPQGNIEFDFSLLSDLLEPIAGIKQKHGKKKSPQELSNIIIQNMHEAPIEVTARLCRAAIPLDDIMNIAVGDVVVFDKKTYESMDVLLNNHPCFKAYPSSSGGRLSLVITQPENDFSL